MAELWLKDWDPICNQCLAGNHGECPDLLMVVEDDVDYGMMACGCTVQGHPHD